jgi:hypothetical protein
LVLNQYFRRHIGQWLSWQFNRWLCLRCKAKAVFDQSSFFDFSVATPIPTPQISSTQPPNASKSLVTVRRESYAECDRHFSPPASSGADPENSQSRVKGNPKKNRREEK